LKHLKFAVDGKTNISHIDIRSLHAVFGGPPLKIQPPPPYLDFRFKTEYKHGAGKLENDHNQSSMQLCKYRAWLRRGGRSPSCV
jgi:hypothetical protein